jgi:predicted transcriptional regulator YdeE
MPEIVAREGFTVVGLSVVGNPRTMAYSDIWANQFMPRKAELLPLSIDGGYYAVFYCAGVPDEVEMLVAMATGPAAEPPAGCVKREVPAATYAVFHCTLATIGATWASVDEWLARSEYAGDRSEKSDFEYYPPETNGPDSPVQVWVPVKPRT